jgi:hypothetical protein
MRKWDELWEKRGIEEELRIMGQNRIVGKMGTWELVLPQATFSGSHCEMGLACAGLAEATPTEKLNTAQSAVLMETGSFGQDAHLELQQKVGV